MASLSHNSIRYNFNVKGRWQPGHQWESFQSSIVYTVVYHMCKTVSSALCCCAGGERPADGVPGVDGEVDGRTSPRHGFARGGMRIGPAGRGRGAMDRNARGGPMMRGRFVTCMILLIFNYYLWA